MRIVCVGGGPAGLYFATLAALGNPGHDVVVVERSPPGVTYGWGVVFWDDLLDELYRCDPHSARTLRAASVVWNEQRIQIGGASAAYLGGYGFSIGRERLLGVLAERAIGLGVDLRFEREVDTLSEFADADLIVACDGANSRVRHLLAEQFEPSVEVGRNKYLWLGTPKIFDAFTFAFEETAAGWIWFHAYRFSSDASTCIVECSPETWAGLGFDALGSDESVRRLEDIFRRPLDGHALINQKRDLDSAPWQQFRRVGTRTWWHDNVALMGDAAHTTHFAIGSGTKLAIQDAIALARTLDLHADVRPALREYERERKAALRGLETPARSSTEWFENVHRHVDQDAIEFAYALRQRRGGDSPWRHRLHLSTQRAGPRRARRWLSSGRRWARSGRRWARQAGAARW